ncbi:hypothetical protein GNI_059420 [Gregarina niphandrodes]|uniref:Uncharacterized protein n=1 Tax=Gregarina niphandrodes TaxID=110365 RepID=A0A023B8K4_GRENI|nr:hypothetical protein GNI_059420 [Gregarina niphandrodes]EZG69138.1 hypothetical protein GNI_059420 [Gregarina niphandrodes]|eukprot:XP_011134469.1 hypothetical protein GNI_059420 [Gregarina niphandrodes]
MTDNIDWKKYVENLKETFDYEYVNHAYNDDSNDSSDGKDDDGNDSDSNDSDSNSGKGDDDNDDDDDDVSLKEVGYSDGEEQDHVRESQPRPEWLIQLRRITSDSLTCGFAFSDAEGRLCVAAAGKLLPLRVYYYDGARLELRFYTLHTGRMVKRARPPKIMCSGHLDHMGGMDALYAVDQKGKVRVYLMVELARQAEETERSRGPIVTFQGTNNGTCPNIFRVLSDRFHEDVLGLNQEHGEDSDDGEDSDQDADDSDEETQDSDENGDGPGSKSGTVVEGTSEYELRPEDTNDDIGFVVAEEGDVLLTEKEDRYLSGGDNHAWFFAVGDAKGGCFVLRLDMYPGTAEYDERVRRFQTERVKELYERTKRARRMKIHVDYVIGQLIDTSPLDRGDQEKHDKFRASLKIQVTDTFKLIPGAISSMEYDDGKMVLAGLDRRLYIHKKTGATWFRTHKINLKGKLTSVVTSV